MSAMRKVKFAVLESSLLARKGTAKPAMSPGALHNDPLDEEGPYANDPTPARDPAGGETEALLASLINRSAARPVLVEPMAGAPEVVAPPVAVAEPEVSPAVEVKAWTRKVAKDRRLANNLHPRGLNRDQAAQYVGLSISTFNRLVAEGVLPNPLHFGRRRVWDRRALDTVLDRLSGTIAPAEARTNDAPAETRTNDA